MSAADRDKATGLTKREMAHMKAIADAVKEFVEGQVKPLHLRNRQLDAEIADLKEQVKELRDAARGR